MPPRRKQKKPRKVEAPPPLLRVRGLRRRFGEVDIFTGLDFQVASGQAVALVGRNGAGKSTVLRCITGADKASAGTVELDGEPLDERSAKIRTDLAVVMDDLDFFPDLSVIEHLDLFAKAHRVADVDSLVDEVLEEVGLALQGGQLPGTLSSGQRRRLALASAFVRPRRLLVLDEPEQRLDAEGVRWLATRLKREKAEGLGVLLASHSPQLVEAVADDVVDVGASGPLGPLTPEAFAAATGAGRAPPERAVTSEIRELRADIRHWRRGRASVKLGEAISDAYVALFATLMLGSMLVNVVVNVRRSASAACTAAGCLEARTMLPWLTGLAAVAGVLAVARLFGPVFVNPAVDSWLLTTPVGRTSVLRPRLLAISALAAVGGGLLAAGASTLGGFTVPAVLAFTGSAALLSLAVVCLAALSQARDGLGSRVVLWTLGLVVWAGLLVLALSAGPIASPPELGTGWLIALVAGAVVALGLLVLAAVRLDRLARRQISPGGSLAPGLSGALATLDLALVYDVLLAHRWHRHDAVRPRRGGPSGPNALVWLDLVRLRRSPQTVIVLAGAAVAAYAVEAAGAGRIVLLVAAVAGFVAALPLLAALRVVTRTPSLERALPFPSQSTRMATLTVPAIALVLYGLLCAAAVHGSVDVGWPDAVVLSVAVGVCALAGVTRWVTGRPPDYTKPLVSTPMGGVPTNLYGTVVRGFDVLLLTTAPLLLLPTVTGALISLGLSAGVLGYLVGRE